MNKKPSLVNLFPPDQFTIAEMHIRYQLRAEHGSRSREHCQGKLMHGKPYSLEQSLLCHAKDFIEREQAQHREEVKDAELDVSLQYL